MSAHLQVTGDLVFSTTAKWRQLGRQYILSSDQPTIEFNDITRCDCSGVALLLSWLRDAKERGKVVRFAHMPSQLSDIAAVYGTLDVLKTGTKTCTN